MKLKYTGVYMSYAALAFVILLVLYGVLVGPMSVTHYASCGLSLAVLGALIQLGVSCFARLSRLSRR